MCTATDASGGEAMTKTVTKWLLGTIGLILLVVGAVRVIVTADKSGLIALIVVGSLLLLSPFVLDRVVGVSVSAVSFELRLTQEISDLGAPKAAEILQRTTLASFAESYAFIRE